MNSGTAEQRNSGTAEQRNSGTAEASDGVVSQSIYALKGLAIIGVVLQHISSASFSAETLNNIWFVRLPFTWCVILFFAISGYLHALSESQRPTNIKTFCRKKLNRLLLPFFVFAIVFALFNQIFLNIPGDILKGTEIRLTFFQHLFSYISDPVRSLLIREPVKSQLYFLPYLFLISVIVHFTLPLRKNHGILFIAIGIFSLGILFQQDIPIKGNPYITFSLGMFHYSAGFLFYRYQNSKITTPATIAIILIGIFAYGLSWDTTNGVIKMAPLIFLLLTKWVGFEKISPLCKLGEASGTVYIYHQPFILPYLLLATAKLSPENYQIFGALFSATISLILCAAFYFLVRKTRFKRILM